MRKPLSPIARRAGWVGCNILLSAIAPEGKLPMVTDGAVTDASTVRSLYDQVRPLSSLSVTKRGWTLEVLRLVRSLARERFSLNDLYMLEDELARLHPLNRNIRPKIRQQLQVLRDLGLVEFLGDGRYAIKGKQ